MQMFPETQMENTTSFMTKRLVLQQSSLSCSEKTDSKIYSFPF